MSKLVENYLLQEPVGKGVYGQVFRAVHQKTKGEYAVKVIPKSSFRSNPKLEQLAINQINILSSLRNEHIVKFIETLKTPNNFYFVYEFCNQGTLESLLQKRKYLKQCEALLYFRQLLDAFKQLNKNSVMHRDLKPDNIFLSDGKIKLGDFGFCKMLEVNMAQTMLGSPIYMAPEILRQQIYTTKADIWSLGVVLFQMLFGYCPFQSSSISELINKLKDLELQIPKHINPITESTEILLRKMLSKDQFKRIEWVDLFDFVIDDRGIIVAGCKKQYAIQTLQKYFLNDSHETTVTLHAQSEKTKKRETGSSNSEQKNHQFKKHDSMPEWNFPEPSNKRVTSVQYLISKREQSQKETVQPVNSLKAINGPSLISQHAPKVTENAVKNEANIVQVVPHKKQDKQSFGKRHHQWLEALQVIQNMMKNQVESSRPCFWLISLLLAKIEEESIRYPEWTDVLIEEKKVLRQSLIKLNEGKESKADDYNRQLLIIWKSKRSESIEKVIKNIYSTDKSKTVEQILTA